MTHLLFIIQEFRISTKLALGSIFTDVKLDLAYFLALLCWVKHILTSCTANMVLVGLLVHLKRYMGQEASGSNGAQAYFCGASLQNRLKIHASYASTY